MSKYGTTPEQYKEIFAKKAKEQIELLQEFERLCHDAGVDLKDFTDRFIWNFFQDVIYDSDDEARRLQKKNDPEGYVSSEFGTILSPTRDEMMTEIKAIKALLESKE
jgi:enamine deaminase RidA (YjgF/YER057c/UK114 family)